MAVLLSRAKTRNTWAAQIRSWRSRDGRYCVEEITSLFGLGQRYIVVETMPGGSQRILSRHRLRSAAVKAAVKIIRRSKP